MLLLTRMYLILNIFTGLSFIYGVFLTGGVSLFYITLGGYLAVVITDFVQFVIQVVAGVSMFVIVVLKLGGVSSIFGIWDQLPPGASHRAPPGRPRVPGDHEAEGVTIRMTNCGGASDAPVSSQT